MRAFKRDMARYVDEELLEVRGADRRDEEYRIRGPGEDSESHGPGDDNPQPPPSPPNKNDDGPLTFGNAGAGGNSDGGTNGNDHDNGGAGEDVDEEAKGDQTDCANPSRAQDATLDDGAATRGCASGLRANRASQLCNYVGASRGAKRLRPHEQCSRVQRKSPVRTAQKMSSLERCRRSSLDSLPAQVGGQPAVAAFLQDSMEDGSLAESPWSSDVWRAFQAWANVRGKSHILHHPAKYSLRKFPVGSR